jgi:hypothetical protein
MIIVPFLRRHVRCVWGATLGLIIGVCRDLYLVSVAIRNWRCTGNAIPYNKLLGGLGIWE